MFSNKNSEAAGAKSFHDKSGMMQEEWSLENVSLYLIRMRADG